MARRKSIEQREAELEAISGFASQGELNRRFRNIRREKALAPVRERFKEEQFRKERGQRIRKRIGTIRRRLPRLRRNVRLVGRTSFTPRRRKFTRGGVLDI